ncbi:hypothetical protein [Nocardioides salsibiostraticola]
MPSEQTLKADPKQGAAPGRTGTTLIVLATTCALLVAIAVAGAAFSVKAHLDRGDDAQIQRQYGDVLASARAEAEAFVNIRFDDAEASIERVRDGATGEFREQYDTSTESVIAVLEQNESVMDGEVVWAGVDTLDNDSARVFAYTSGTVANLQTAGKPVERNFRLQLDLVLVEGEWLTKNLEFVA